MSITWAYNSVSLIKLTAENESIARACMLSGLLTNIVGISSKIG